MRLRDYKNEKWISYNFGLLYLYLDAFLLCCEFLLIIIVLTFPFNFILILYNNKQFCK